jgi:Tfp pilus assembly protein PilN
VSARLGVELGPELVRAVRLDGWGRRLQILELHWDPTHPAQMVAELRESLGPAARLAVTVDLSFLFAKQVRLPQLSAVEKRRILTLEPERFFPVRGEELVLAARDEDNLVFAARASVLGGWLEALEAIGAVELVEPSPVSLARIVGKVDSGDVMILMQGNDQGVGIAEIGAGRVRRIRRTSDPSELATAVAETAKMTRQIYLRPLNGNAAWHPLGAALDVGELPSIAGVAPSHLAAYGAALGIGSGLDEALLPTELARRITRRRRRALSLGCTACVLALVFALLSLDEFRSRTLRRLEAESAPLHQPAERTLALQRQADILRQEAQSVAALKAERLDPLLALAALTRRLPPGAYLTALRATGRDWQIDGYAREAAPLVGRLEEDAWFDNVHFLTATSRTRMDGKLYESFSIALRLVPAP